MTVTPEDYYYHEEHDWVGVDGDIATFGITDHAQEALGDIVYFDGPDVGDSVTAGESYGEIESVKAVSDVIAPLDGEIVEVNEDISEEPESINEEPYSAWLIKIRMEDAGQLKELMSADEYEDMLSAAEAEAGSSSDDDDGADLLLEEDDEDYIDESLEEEE